MGKCRHIDICKHIKSETTDCEAAEICKYFYGELGTEKREKSVRQLVHRVSRTIADWGKADGVFESDVDVEAFYDDLTWLCVNQYG